MVQGTKKGGSVDCHLSPPCCDTPFSSGTSLRAVDASLPTAGDSCCCCVPPSSLWERETQERQERLQVTALSPRDPGWLSITPLMPLGAPSTCPIPAELSWDLRHCWQMTRDVAFGDTGGCGSGWMISERFSNLSDSSSSSFTRSSLQLRRFHAHASHGTVLV